MNPVSKLLIRADANPRIGTGHVMRCIALGQAFKRMGGSVEFASGPLPGKLLERLLEEGFECTPLDNFEAVADVEELNHHIARMRPDWLLLDGYRFSDQYQSQLRIPGTRLACIDDFGHAAHERAELVINQNIYACDQDYDHLDANDVLTGPHYAMLRKEFLAADTDQHPQVPVRARRILVTFGGADPENMTARIIDSVDKATVERSSIDVIVGPCYQHVDSLRDLIKSSRSTIRLHRNVDNMYALMSRTHLAITAGGSTCYELARCGVPSVVIPIADNQIPVAQKVSELGIAEWLEPEDLQNTRLQRALSKIIRDVDRRRNMSDISQQVIDGHGANRVARRLVSQAFNFRDATLEDSSLLLNWRNEPEIRAISFQNETIPFEAHQSWLTSKLTSKHTHLQVIEDCEGKPVAQVRLDFAPQRESAAISINLIPTYRGRGLGTALIERTIRETAKYYPEILLIARIKASNIASQQAFRKAGFSPSTSKTINDQVALEYVYQIENRSALLLRHAS